MTHIVQIDAMKMNKSSIYFHSILLITSAMICHKPYAQPLNLSDLKKELIQYHDSGEYNKDIQQVTTQVEQYLIEARKQEPKQKLALVLDIDETCLSSFEDMKKRDFGGSLKAIHNSYSKAHSTLIRPCLHMYNTALKQNINVFFVSGRYQYQKQATIQNLAATGFKNWTGLYLNPDQNIKKHIVEAFKIDSRKQITAAGYKIIANVGDQDSDLSGGYSEKTFKLPNPFYKTSHA